MGAHNTDIRWFRSQPTAGGYSSDKIDAENGIISDVVMVEEGMAKGHNVSLDAQFIHDLVAYDNRVHKDRGVKARFGHPGASNETMGTQMGVFKDIRARKMGGKMQAIGNLHLLAASEDSPTHPNMRSWMLKMAAERPDFVMSSIVFRASGHYQKNEDGTKAYVEGRGDVNPDLGEVFVEFGDTGEHFYTDLVEEGAATSSLFSNKINPHLFVAQADEFLATHPHITEFIKAHPDKVIAFFDSVGVNISQLTQKKMSKLNLLAWLKGEEGEVDTAELAELRTSLKSLQDEMKAFKADKEAADNRVSELETANGTLQESLTASAERVTALETELAASQEEIVELKKDPADRHTGGGDGDGDGKLRAYQKNPIYQQFRKPAAK